MDKPKQRVDRADKPTQKQPSTTNAGTCRAVVQRENTVDPAGQRHQQQHKQASGQPELPQSGNLSTRVWQRVQQAPTLGNPGGDPGRQAESGTPEQHPAPLNNLNYRDRRAALQKGPPVRCPLRSNCCRNRDLHVGCLCCEEKGGVGFSNPVP